MAKGRSVERVFAFDEFRFDARTGELIREGARLQLPPQPAKLLHLLLRSPGELVTREEIREGLWEGDTFVDFEHGINKCVKQVREYLGDNVGAPGYLQTIPRRGYRFLGLVRVESSGLEVLEPERSPYPGLSAFTEVDAPFFLGRESEVEVLWNKIASKRLLALIGPSGAGKSSLVNAGLLPARPEDFRVVIATPGAAPLAAIARAMVPELSDDARLLQQLVSVDLQAAVKAVACWRKRCGRALLVVDAFEELFTLAPPPMRNEFAELVNRVVSQADVHVLLSMRDDFFFRCHEHEELAPIFQDVTPVGPLRGPALRRALVEPARAYGYRFEDDRLVDAMLAEVHDERGALPLLAFAAARLWEKRDRERKLLTRAGYEEIGRVGGALARHAEATLERIGSSNAPVVREIFRNLVAAQGTRASREREELLSVFANGSEREGAERTLGKLLAARLLTSYEDVGGAGARRIEIIHESLLSAWPRLERWRTQDSEGMQLRDQLRQSAHLWNERGRRDDLLWTGTSFRELALWRERYPVCLSAMEQSFVDASTRLAGRTRKRKRAVVGMLLAAALGVAAVTSSLWGQAEREALRAEAAKLLALGQLELERYPTGALAYALRSLEVADTREARLFALRVMQTAPIARVASTYLEDGLEAHQVEFSVSGDAIAVGGYRKVQILHQDGRKRTILRGEHSTLGFRAIDVAFAPEGNVLVTKRRRDLRFLSLPEGDEWRRIELEEGVTRLFHSAKGFVTSTTANGREIIRSWRFDGTEEWIGSMEPPDALDVNPFGTELAYALGSKIYVRSLEEWTKPPRLVGEHATGVIDISFHPNGERLAATEASGEIRIWATARREPPLRLLRAPSVSEVRFSPKGRWLAALGREGRAPATWLWDMTAPPGVKPIALRTSYWIQNGLAFSPDERWLATADVELVSFWPLGVDYASVFDAHEGAVIDIEFAPDGTALFSSSWDDTVRFWPLRAESPEESRILLREPGIEAIHLDPEGTRMAGSTDFGGVFIAPLEGGERRELRGFSENCVFMAVAFSPDGRLLAAAPLRGPAREKVIRVWDVESGDEKFQVAIPGAGEGFQGGIYALTFLDSERIAVAGRTGGILLFDTRKQNIESVSSGDLFSLVASRSGRFCLGGEAIPLPGESHRKGKLLRFDFDGREQSAIPFHDDPAASIDLDPTETLVASGTADGIVRVGALSGGEPHYFFGHLGLVRQVRFSPDGRWMASSGEDRTIRYWRLSETAEVPWHTRSRDEILAILRSRTNVRIVPDPASMTGFKLEVGPFPGWAKLPP